MNPNVPQQDARTSHRLGPQVAAAVGLANLVPVPTPFDLIRLSSPDETTPHVVGIAALWSQQTGERGSAFWPRLIFTARKIGRPVTNVGAGLVQAPQ